MRTLTFTLLLAASTLAMAADKGTNCPAAFRPYSADTPLLDLLINPATKEIVNRDLPGFLDKMPKMLTGATPPTLADVLTIRIMAAEFGAIPKRRSKNSIRT